MKVTSIRRYEEQHRSNAKNVKVLVFVDFETMQENIERRLITGPRQVGAPIKPSTIMADEGFLRAMKTLRLTSEKITWSNYAGCGMCPCSPGYVVKCKETFYSDGAQSITEDSRFTWDTPIYAIWLSNHSR